MQSWLITVECARMSTSIFPSHYCLSVYLFSSHSAPKLMELRAWPLSYKLYLNLSIILKLAPTDPILRNIEEACLYRVSTQRPPTNSRVFLRINYRLSFACLKLTEVCLVVWQCHWAHPHLVPHSAAVCLNVCACLSMRLSVYLLHFHRCHSFSHGKIKAQKPLPQTSAIIVSDPQSPSLWREAERSLQASTANRIINFLSKDITPSGVKRGKLWREHVLMSFMTLQIMHYRQEQNGGSKHNCIDFSLMATNNDISLDPREEQDGLLGPRAHTQALTCA